MIGIVDVGGGTRGIYGAGVFDRCLDDGIIFDYVIGVSAGSANAAAYTAGQRGRNYVFYTDYSFRKEYMSAGNLLKTGSYLSLDYIYGTLSNTDGDYPLDYDALAASPVNFDVVTTDANTGEPVYLNKKDLKKDDYWFFKASCCVPVVCRPYTVNGTPYYNGGISDPVPLRRAFAMGCDKVVVILTKPRDAEISNKRNALAGKILQNKYPASAKKVAACNDLYLQSVEAAKRLEKEGKVP